MFFYFISPWAFDHKKHYKNWLEIKKENQSINNDYASLITNKNHVSKKKQFFKKKHQKTIFQKKIFFFQRKTSYQFTCYE